MANGAFVDPQIQLQFAVDQADALVGPDVAVNIVQIPEAQAKT